MPEFLKLHQPQEALDLWLRNLPTFLPHIDVVDTIHSLGRITASPVISNEMLPAFTRSGVDGYAVIASDTFGASETLPMYLKVIGEVPMGQAPTLSIKPGEAVLIHTGGMVPDGANAVVMLEYTQQTKSGEIEIYKAVAFSENLLLAGEDVKPGDEVIAVGRKMRPAEIGGLLALGIMQVSVAKKPRVGILSSGDEVIPPQHKPQLGQVRDINSYSLGALVQDCGGEAQIYGIVPDRPEELANLMRTALSENDLVLVTAGSSASVRDFTSEVIQGMGQPGVLVHGVNIRPGKPTILAVCDGKPVVGLPGNPVSALVIAELFVRPVIYRLLGMPEIAPRGFVKARLKINLPSLTGREEWVPVRLKRSGQEFTAEPIFFKSNLIFMLATADGLVKILPAATGLDAGEEVSVMLF